MQDGKIALFSFEADKAEIKIISERHYKLVENEELADEELIKYRKRK